MMKVRENADKMIGRPVEVIGMAISNFSPGNFTWSNPLINSKLPYCINFTALIKFYSSLCLFYSFRKETVLFSFLSFYLLFFVFCFISTERFHFFLLEICFRFYSVFVFDCQVRVTKVNKVRVQLIEKNFYFV